jgi:hypothetical protein
MAIKLQAELFQMPLPLPPRVLQQKAWEAEVVFQSPYQFLSHFLSQFRFPSPCQFLCQFPSQCRFLSPYPYQCRYRYQSQYPSQYPFQFQFQRRHLLQKPRW